MVLQRSLGDVKKCGKITVIHSTNGRTYPIYVLVTYFYILVFEVKIYGDLSENYNLGDWAVQNGRYNAYTVSFSVNLVIDLGLDEKLDNYENQTRAAEFINILKTFFDHQTVR